MLLATLFFRPNDNYDAVCVYDCQFADDLIPGTYTDKECEEMGGEPQAAPPSSYGHAHGRLPACTYRGIIRYYKVAVI